ncbi:unnamed protein product [Linum trigynum]|uniref:Arabidopsis retrotransposon Orf1 C-terminal domain-containing protein n=1 Tax=Linum trigynum TaxID=586398 RepID=A0AAV2DLQ4_9ROSI
MGRRRYIPPPRHFKVTDQSEDGKTVYRSWMIEDSHKVTDRDSPIPEVPPQLQAVNMPARFYRVITGQVGPTMRSRTIEMTSPTPSPPQQPAQMPTEEPPLPDSTPVVSPESRPAKRSRLQQSSSSSRSQMSSSSAPAPSTTPRRTSLSASKKKAGTPPPKDVSKTFGQPVQLQKHKEEYADLMKRAVTPSQFMDYAALQKTERAEEVMTYFRRMNWARFPELHFPTYPHLTRAFLATYSFENNGVESKLQSTLAGKTKSLSLSQVNRALLFDGPADAIPDEKQDLSEFWTTIVADGKEFNPTSSRRASIRDPIIPLVHDYLARTVLGKGSNASGVYTTDLRYIHSFVTGTPLCVGYMVGKMLENDALKTCGAIMCGGIITALARAYWGFPENPTGLEISDGSTLLGEATLGKLGFLRIVGSRGEYLSIAKYKEWETKVNRKRAARAARATSASASSAAPSVATPTTAPAPTPTAAGHSNSSVSQGQQSHPTPVPHPEDTPPVIPASPSSTDELRARITLLEARDAEKDKKIQELNRRLDEKLGTSSSTPPS